MVLELETPANYVHTDQFSRFQVHNLQENHDPRADKI
jgi:hypothetical protein